MQHDTFTTHIGPYASAGKALQRIYSMTITQLNSLTQSYEDVRVTIPDVKKLNNEDRGIAHNLIRMQLQGRERQLADEFFEINPYYPQYLKEEKGSFIRHGLLKEDKDAGIFIPTQKGNDFSNLKMSVIREIDEEEGIAEFIRLVFNNGGEISREEMSILFGAYVRRVDKEHKRKRSDEDRTDGAITTIIRHRLHNLSKREIITHTRTNIALTAKGMRYIQDPLYQE